MKKRILISCLVSLSLFWGTAQSQESFEYVLEEDARMVKGFERQVDTVATVKSNAWEDQKVSLVGRLTDYVGEDHYIFTDHTDSIEVILDPDHDWSNVSKDQLIRIYGEVDRDMFFTTIEVEYAQPIVERVKKVKPQKSKI